MGSGSRTAAHEAGHACVCLALGVGVKRMTLSPGRTTLMDDPSPRDCLYIKLAGAAAETIAFGAYDEESTRSDRVDADREAFDLTHDLDATDALVREAMVEVTDLLRERWTAVRRVSLMLMRHPNTLTAADLSLVKVAPYQLKEAA
jgi:hypothetical protein